MKYHMPLIALALSAVATSGVHASTGTASLKLKDFSIKAVDLVTGDDLPASFDILPSGAETNIYLFIAGNPTLTQKVQGLFSPLTLSGSFGIPPLNGSEPPVQGTASINAEGINIQVSGSGSDYQAQGSASSNDYFSESLNIRVAPGTGVIASGTLQMAVATQCTAYCAVDAQLYATFGGGDEESKTSFVKYVGVYGSNGGSDSFFGPAGTTYMNFSDQYQDLTLTVLARASVFAQSVPEPANIALLLAGLVTVAAMRRRSA